MLQSVSLTAPTTVATYPGLQFIVMHAVVVPPGEWVPAWHCVQSVADVAPVLSAT